MIETSRRSLITGLVSLIVAPSIVRASSLMPISVIDNYYERYIIGYAIASDALMLRIDRANFPLHDCSKYVIAQLNKREAELICDKITLNNLRSIAFPADERHQKYISSRIDYNRLALITNGKYNRHIDIARD